MENEEDDKGKLIDVSQKDDDQEEKDDNADK